MNARPARAARSINPANGEVIAEYPYAGIASIEPALEAAASGYRDWSSWDIGQRANALTRVATLLRRDADALALLATREMGKPITDARAEVEKCAALCDWYAERGPTLLADEPSPVSGSRAYVAFRPLGTVFAVMPWNFPYWQAMRGAVPILIGGNGFLLKPASNVVGCALALEKIMAEAGLPLGTFAVLNAPHELALSVLDDRRIAAATVTGGVRAGAAVAAKAGAALKKSLLELGGTDPFVVLADADLEGAVRAAVKSRYQNAGQVCIAAKRFILEAPIAEDFTRRFIAAVASLKVGDPTDEATQIGPMARADLRDELHEQVEKSLAAGAILLHGGHAIEGAGSYYAPTVLGNVQPGMVAFDEELFGPVAALTVARDVDHAIELANHSDFGLSGALWSRDEAAAERLAAGMETGAVFINGFSASDPRVPIGGIKRSGYGRELSHFGAREFVNAQTVWLGRP